MTKAFRHGLLGSAVLLLLTVVSFADELPSGINAGSMPELSRMRRQTGQPVSVATLMRNLVPGLSLREFGLPDGVTLQTIADRLIPTNVITVPGIRDGEKNLLVHVPIPRQSSSFSSLIPSGVRFQNLLLVVIVHDYVNSTARRLSVSASGHVLIGGVNISATVIFSSSRQGNFRLILAPGEKLNLGALLSTTLPKGIAEQINTAFSLNAVEASDVSSSVNFGAKRSAELFARMESLSQVVKTVGGSLADGALGDALQDAGLSSFDLRNVSVSLKTSDGNTIIRVGGSPVLPAHRGIKMYAEVIGRYSRKGRKPSFVIRFTSGPVQLGKIMKAFIPALDLSDTPFGNYQLPAFAVSMSRGSPLPDFIPYLPHYNDALSSHFLDLLGLKPGVRFLTKIVNPSDFPRLLPSPMPQNFLQNLPGFYISGSLGVGVFSFSQLPIPGSLHLTIGSLLSSFLPSLDLGRLPLPSGFPNLSAFKLNTFGYDVRNKDITLSFTLPVNFDVLPFIRPGLLRLGQTTGQIQISLKRKPYQMAFTASGFALLGTLPVKFSLSRQPNSGYTYGIELIREISLRLVLSQLGDLSTVLRDAVSTLGMDSSLHNGTVRIRTRPTVITLGGTISYRTLPQITIETIFIEPRKSNSTACIGLDIASTSFSNIIKAFISASADISDVPLFGALQVPNMKMLYCNKSQLIFPAVNVFSNAKFQRIFRAPTFSRKVFTGLLPVSFPDVGVQELLMSLRPTIDFSLPLNTVSVRSLFQKILPSVSPSSVSFPGLPVPSVPNIFVNGLKFNVGLRLLSFDAAMPRSLTIPVIPRVVEISQVRFKVEISARPRRHDFSLEGLIAVGGEQVKASLKKIGSNYRLEGRAARDIDIIALGKQFGVSFQSLSGLLPANSPFLTSFAIQNARVEVAFPQSRNAKAIFLSGSVVLKGLPRTTIKLIFLGIGTPQKTMVAGLDVAAAKLADIIHAISGLDVRDLPGLGSLSFPNFGVTVSTANVDLPSTISFSTELLDSFKRLTRGVAINFRQQIQGRLRYYRVALARASFNIELRSPVSLDGIITGMFPTLKTINAYTSLSQVIPGVFQLSVSRLQYQGATREFTIEAHLPSLIIVPGVFSAQRLTLIGTIRKGTSSKAAVSFALAGAGTVAGLSVQTRLAYDSMQRAYKIELRSANNRLDLAQVFKGVTPLGLGNNPVVAALHLDRAAINNPVFEMVKQGQGIAFNAIGRPEIMRFDDFDAQLTALTQPKRLVFMLNKENGNMLQTLQSLIGVNFDGVPFVKMLSGPAGVGMIFSSQTMAEMPMPAKNSPLNEITAVRKGLSIVAKLQLPDCSSDIFCKFFKHILGDRELVFIATDIRGRAVTIASRVPGGVSFAGFELKNIQAGLRLGTVVPSFGLTHIELDVPTPDSKTLHFIGSLAVDPLGNAEATMQMSGIYNTPLGFPFAAIGNLRAQIRSNIACPICVSALSLGGELRIGRRCLGNRNVHCILGQGYFGVDVREPENNFFYFRLNEFSFRKLLTSLSVPNVPGMEILDFSSLHDITLSYSLNGATLPKGRVPNAVTVPAGLVLKGKINFLFLVGINVDVIVSTTLGAVTSVKGTLAADPINIGPLISMTSTADSSKGPVFTINAGVNPPSFGILLDGQLRIPALQVNAKATGSISKRGFSVSVSAPLFGVPSDFTVEALFENAANPSSFQGAAMRGSVGGNVAAKITSSVKSALTVVKDQINNKLELAKDALDKIQAAFNTLFNNMKAKRAVKVAKEAAFNSAKKAVDVARSALDAVCKIHDCEKCVPKICTTRKCFCGAKYPCGFLSWCCRDVCVPVPKPCGQHCFNEPVCEAKNIACWPLRKAAEKALESAEKAFDLAKQALQAAIKAYEDALNAMNKYNPTLLAARAAVNTIQGLLNTILGFLNPFPFVINRIGFNMEVTRASRTAFAVKLEMTVLGKAQELYIALNINNPAAIGGQIARRFFSGAFDLLKRIPAIPTP